MNKAEKRQLIIDIGAEFLAWAINHQEKSKHVDEVMLTPWWEWLDEAYPYNPNVCPVCLAGDSPEPCSNICRAQLTKENE